MIREWLSVTLLAGVGTIANAAPNSTPSDSLGNVLKQRAQQVFGLSDKDHDQVLNRDEQANAEKRMQTAFSLLSQANTLAGPRIPATVAEPTPGNSDLLTAQEFIQLFQARAAKYDAQLRAKRFARSHPPAMPKMVPTAFASSNNSNWQNHKDWSDKKDRSDKDDWKAPHFNQQSNFQSQTNWPMMNHSNGYHSHVVHHSSHRGDSGGSYGYGGSFGGGGGGFMSGGGSERHSEKHEGKHEGGRHHHK